MESGKAAGDLISQVGGGVVEINSELEDAPEQLNADAFGCCIMKVKLSGTPGGLMDSNAYQAMIAEGGH